MIPINLAIIGAGAQAGKRGRGFLLGATYGVAMALVYGVLGLIVILTAGTFGTINASPWFNLGDCGALRRAGPGDVRRHHRSTSRAARAASSSAQESRGTVLLAFGMGAVAALLAGACVAPVVIQVVVFASDLYAQRRRRAALALPFVLGLGMALPWPIAGAGFAALPKPGAWMVRVKQVMGVFILGNGRVLRLRGVRDLREALGRSRRRVARERERRCSSRLAGVARRRARHGHAREQAGAHRLLGDLVQELPDDGQDDAGRVRTVKAALDGYVKIKFQAEDLDASPARELMQRVGGVGLPTYVILQPR